MGHRISDMAKSDGTPIEAGKTYRIAGWASFNQTQDRRPVWDVVAHYLRGLGEVKLDQSSRVRLKGVDGNAGYRT